MGGRRNAGRGEAGLVLAAAAGLSALMMLQQHQDSAPAPAPVADVPAKHLALYHRYGDTCPGLDWALLAGVGKVETNHGRSRLPGVRSGTNYAGAAGPMQFLLPTWQEVRSKHPEIGGDVYDPRNAIPAAAHYLCDGGLRQGRGVRAALWTYNHSTTYADQVLSTAARYRAAATAGAL